MHKQSIFFFQILIILIFNLLNYEVNAQLNNRGWIAANNSNFTDMEVGDLDGDQDLDIIYNTGYSIFWYENSDGKGNYKNPVEITSAQSIYSLCSVFDYDNDNDLDIITNEGYETILILKNDGNAHFERTKISGISRFEPDNNNHKIADLDNNGYKDIIGMKYNSLFWIRNSPNDPLDTLISLNKSGSDFEIGDFDNDNDIDILLIGNSEGILSLLLNDGSGHFTSKYLPVDNYNSGDKRKAVCFDYDGDGKLDFVTFTLRGNNISHSLDAFINKEDYEFEKLNIANNIDAFGLIDLNFGDFNQDNSNDFIITTRFTNILIEDKVNLLSPDTIATLVNSNQQYKKILIFDSNHDNKPDILYLVHYNDGSRGNTSLKILKNHGNSDFIQDQIVHRSPHTSQSYLFSDIDSDNDLDIISGLSYYENKGENNYHIKDFTIISDIWDTRFQKEFLTDLDKDGDDDIIFFSIQSFSSLINEGEGKFHVAQNQPLPTQISYTSAVLYDFDNDNDLDIIISTKDENTNAYIGIYSNEDGGNFKFSKQILSAEKSEIARLQFVTLDNNENKVLLYFKKTDQDTYFIPHYLHLDNTNFEDNIITGLDSVFFFNYDYISEPVDFNNDGLSDFLYSTFSTISWFKNLGNNKFKKMYLYNTKYQNYITTYSDYDQDGYLDIIYFSILDTPNDGVYLLKNNGDETFAQPQLLFRSPIRSKQFLFDINRDGAPDLFMGPDGANSNYCGLSYILNQYNKQYVINGLCFIDNNENGFKEENEPVLPNFPLSLNGTGKKTYSRLDGTFKFVGNTGSNKIIPDPSGNYSLTTSLSTITLPSTSENFIHIGLKEIAPINKWELDFIPDMISCNGQFKSKLIVTNKGTQPESGLIKLDPLGKQIKSITPNPDSINNGKYYWNLSNINANHNLQFEINYDPQTMEDRTFQANLLISGSTGNIKLDSAIKVLLPPCQTQTFNKSVYPIGEGEDGNVPITTNEFKYIIQFRNTSNTDAYHVKVTDILDSDLDINTFQLLSSNEDFTFNINSKGYFEATFDTVKTNHDCYLSYSIKKKVGLEIGTNITNVASIAWDNGQVYQTNQTKNKLVKEIVSSLILSETENILIYPNPVDSEINIEGHFDNTSTSNLYIYNLTGQRVYETNFVLDQGVRKKEINLNSLPSGMYIIKLNIGEKIYNWTFIKL